MNTRKHDLKTVETGLKSKDPLMRKVARNAGNEIKKQLNNSWIRSARERLVEETKKGNRDNAFQIREDMVRHRGGRQGKGNKGEMLTAGIHWAENQYERIFGHD